LNREAIDRKAKQKQTGNGKDEGKWNKVGQASPRNVSGSVSFGEAEGSEELIR
jgi:hypothetical protein